MEVAISVFETEAGTEGTDKFPFLSSVHLMESSKSCEVDNTDNTGKTKGYGNHRSHRSLRSLTGSATRLGGAANNQRAVASGTPPRASFPRSAARPRVCRQPFGFKPRRRPVTETFVNPRTGQAEDVEYVVNPGGAVHSVSSDHPAVRVARGGGDRGERVTFAGFRFATPGEIARAKKREGVA